MAFPTLVGSATWDASSVTAHKAQMPASGIVAGDLIVAMWHRTGGVAVGTVDPAWTEVAVGTGTNQGGRVATRVASGSENGALLDLCTLPGTANGVSITLVFRGVASVPTALWDVGTGSPTIDPPALTSGFGAVDTTWVIYAGSGNQTSVPVTLPANYGAQVSDGNTARAAAIGTRNRTAATEDPGAITWGGGVSINGVVATVAVPGIMPPTAQPRAFGAII
jgi:hypothetical protein